MVENGAFDQSVSRYIQTHTQESLPSVFEHLRADLGQLSFDQTCQIMNAYFLFHTGAYVEQVIANAKKEKNGSNPA